MDRSADFFISYTSADRAWAEWIAWQLEAEGYHVVIQAWDFIPGRSWVHEMQHATSTAERIVAVLSAAYLASAHGEAEWEVFYAKDPRGQQGRLLPVRVEEVEPPGLLTTRIYVDLVNQDAAGARATLLAAARGIRAKPAHEPEFPGRRQAVSAVEAPRFPGELPPGVAQRTPTEVAATRGPTPITEPPARIVDPMGRGDHQTLSEALREARPGDRVLVRPGLYEEGLVIDKPIQVIGNGPVEEIVIRTDGSAVLIFNATMGRVANLTLRHVAGGMRGVRCGVDIAQGRLELEGCDVQSDTLCVAIHNEADPHLRRNSIHDSLGGVHVYGNGQGTIEDNEIFNHRGAGIEITTGAKPTVRRNRIHDCNGSGVVVDHGQADVFAGQFTTGGTIEDNEIFDNRAVGVVIDGGGTGPTPLGGADPIVRRNHIHGSTGGVLVWRNGKGKIEDNEIFDNAMSGMKITTGANPTVRRNRIHDNGTVAIWVAEGGAGRIEDNDLRGNRQGAWKISADSWGNVRARNRE